MLLITTHCSLVLCLFCFVPNLGVFQAMDGNSVFAKVNVC